MDPQIQDNETKLIRLLHAIKEDVEKYGSTTLSSHGEDWSPEVQEVLRELYEDIEKPKREDFEDEDCTEEDVDEAFEEAMEDYQEFTLGRGFRTAFQSVMYKSVSIPFHCYATKGGDVLFSKETHKWIASSDCYDFELDGSSVSPHTGGGGSNSAGCLSVVVLALISLIIPH